MDSQVCGSAISVKGARLMSWAGRWWRRLAAGLLLVWCLAAAVSALRAALALPVDPMAQQESEYRQFAGVLPEFGIVSYLEPDEDDDVGDAVRAYYAAQYALAPRVVQDRVGAEFLIVPRGTVRPEEDERLKGYSQVLVLPSGHRLFRRLTP